MSSQPSVIAGSGRRRTLGQRRSAMQAACPGEKRGLRTAPGTLSLAGRASVISVMTGFVDERWRSMRTMGLCSSLSRRAMPRRGGRCGAGYSARRPTCSWLRRPRLAQGAWPGRRLGHSVTDGKWLPHLPSEGGTAARRLALPSWYAKSSGCISLRRGVTSSRRAERWRRSSTPKAAAQSWPYPPTSVTALDWGRTTWPRSAARQRVPAPHRRRCQYHARRRRGLRLCPDNRSRRRGPQHQERDLPNASWGKGI